MKSRVATVRCAAAMMVVACAGGAGGGGGARAAIIPLSAGYTVHADSSAHDLFAEISDVRDQSFSRAQPSPHPFGPHSASALTSAHIGSKKQPPTGVASAGVDASEPLTSGWSAAGTASADVTGDFFFGLLGKGRAWSEAAFMFVVTQPTPYAMSGVVSGRSNAFIDPTWVNFEQSSVVELWRGGTLVHSAAGAEPGVPLAYSFSGVLSPGEYRIEGRARARTESLAFNQPWEPSSSFSVGFTIPGPGVAVCVLCAAPITAFRRRRARL